MARIDSLQGRLALWLSVAIISVAVVAGMIAFVAAFREAHELQDDMLRQTAALLEQNGLSGRPQAALGASVISDPESRLLVQMLPSERVSGGPHTDATFPLALSPSLADGLHTVVVGHETYRVLVRTLTQNHRLAVAQATAFRDEIAQDSALHTLLPFLFLVPFLIVVASSLIRTIFHPIARLSQQIDHRSEQELHPLTVEAFPQEIRPFVIAINRLFQRVDQSMALQRRFIADAAHELRSPMTALSLQAERLAEAEMSSSGRQRLGDLRKGIERARKLLDQLLTFARSQAMSTGPSPPLSVQQVYRQVLEDLLPLAEAKSIDIGITSAVDAWLAINAVDLLTLVKNVVDNALRYTPPSGRVDLSVSIAPGTVNLVVEDNGPGIPKEERERVFDPFYRVLGNEQIGSGLGLSIVRTIAQRIGASVTLAATDPLTETGLRVMITLVDMGNDDEGL
ncbi:MAG: ATP-binding protein [Desulfobulbus sp.]|nr:ATP-binding protein [Desulfobulbus sp.]